MAAFGLILYLVIFFFVFRFIWRNTTTISYSGMSGFFSSWLGQLVWAGFIAGVILIIFMKALEWVGNLFGSYSGEIVGLIFAGIAYCALSNNSDSTQSDTSSETDRQLLSKKTFWENYNRNVRELKEKESSISDTALFALANKGDDSLTLPEEFLSKSGTFDSVEVKGFPQLAISHDDLEDDIKIFLMFSYDDTKGDFIQELITKIAFTAAIESVAPGKNLEIESALGLINDNGNFGLPSCDNEPEKKFERTFKENGIMYLFSRDDKIISLCFFK
ncbi:MAG: hypothetical protein IKZ53_08435 [Selenomonadaceae bacterium]|nr:hypothetical protein [Selenomonadaceae bacterium]